jgi:hypothetical protein
MKGDFTSGGDRKPCRRQRAARRAARRCAGGALGRCGRGRCVDQGRANARHAPGGDADPLPLKTAAAPIARLLAGGVDANTPFLADNETALMLAARAKCRRRQLDGRRQHRS